MKKEKLKQKKDWLEKTKKLNRSAYEQLPETKMLLSDQISEADQKGDKRETTVTNLKQKCFESN